MFKVVIIGGMAAGCKAAARLSRLSDRYDITVIERNPFISFGNCGLPLYASGEIDDFYELSKTAYGVIRDEDYFLNVKGIKFCTKTEVNKIDTKKRQVHCVSYENNQTKTFDYDALIVATGSKANEPKFQFPKFSIISPFHSPQDAKDFREAAQKGKVGKAIIIGGGFIGCELTEALTTLWGIDSVLIEKEDSLLSNFLDKEISKIMENKISENDVDVLLSHEIVKVEMDEKGAPVTWLKCGEKISSDYVFYNLGVKPETSLAKEAGIEVGKFGGILVDEYMRTSVPNIWAAGDCVQMKNLVTGDQDYFPLGSLSNRMGRVIADSIDGKGYPFPGTVGSISLKIFGLTVSATGLTERKAQNSGIDTASVIGCWSDRPDYHPESKHLFGKLIYEKKTLRLLGLQLIGEGEVSRYVDIFSTLLSDRKTVYDLIHIEHGYTPAHSSPISPLNYLGFMVINQEADGLINVNPTKLDSFEGTIIDVRETVEIKSNLFNREVFNIPLSVFREKRRELKKDKPILLVCEKGPRSYEAAKILFNDGITGVSYLGGGTLFYQQYAAKSKKEENLVS